MIWDGVTILDGVFVGPGVFLTNDLYPRSPRLAQARERYRGRGWLVPTLVKEGASLGAGAVIRAGITIHEFALVGAGAVVTKDVPPYSLVVGNPARRRGWVCQCGQPLRFENGGATCHECGRRFAKQGDVVTHVPAQSRLNDVPGPSSAAANETRATLAWQLFPEFTSPAAAQF